MLIIVIFAEISDFTEILKSPGKASEKSHKKPAVYPKKC